MTAVLDIISTQQSQLQTTDNSQQTLHEYTVPEHAVVKAIVEVVARRNSNGDMKTWHRAVTLGRQTGGADVVGSIVDIIGAQGSTGTTFWSIAINANGNNLRVQVTGQNSHTIDWAVSISGIVLREGA
jgi:hypothetical protein